MTKGARPRSLTAFEKRLPCVSHADGMAAFSRAFATDAFRSGISRKAATAPVLTSSTLERLNRFGYGGLGRACLAYVLSQAMPGMREDHRTFGKLIKVIRDSAEAMAEAADELAEQMRRQEQRSSYRDPLRFPALLLLSAALHDRFFSLIGETKFMELIAPDLIDVPLSDNEMTHGLSGLVGLYDAADQILKDFNRDNYVLEGFGEPKAEVRTQHQANYERQAFIRELASVFREVLQQSPSAQLGFDGQTAPFMRFVGRIYGELRVQTLATLAPKSVKTPSAKTVQNILKEWPIPS